MIAMHEGFDNSIVVATNYKAIVWHYHLQAQQRGVDMKIHEKETIYENKKWKLTALLHVNGTYSGNCTNKTTMVSHKWYKMCNRIVNIPDIIPQYLRDIISSTIKEIPKV